MRNTGSIMRAAAVAAGLLLGASSASAQMPMPTNETPTINGAQTINGIALTAEVGFPALRVGALFGKGGAFDFGVQLAAPTYGEYDINGYHQNLGMDVRVPLRFRLLETGKLVGSLRVAPLFHVGRPVSACGRGVGNAFGVRVNVGCDPNVGMGATVGWMMDIALPKIFKLIVGPEARMGFVANNGARFAGGFLVDAGIEAFWKEKMFFTFLLQVGASFGSKNYGGEPVFREFMGFGYKFK